MKVLIVGNGAREHAIGRSLARSNEHIDLLTYGAGINPGLADISTVYSTGSVTDVPSIVSFAQGEGAGLAFIGPEAPLSRGLADALWSAGIPCVGPTRSLARIETSKRFTRDLLKKYDIPGRPRYKYFDSINGVEDFLSDLGDKFVVKYDGLMGGKGVKVSGDHLRDHEDALSYCRELISVGGTFIIEEKFEGEEFSLMSFCDGKHIKHMIPVQDHKRAYENDTGPNTGGMGSYTGPDGNLPFLTDGDIAAASAINESTFSALNEECAEEYHGILYGGFMATADGIKLIEYNARFGDPEAMNLLVLLKTDFFHICRSIVEGTLDQVDLDFDKRASVCKYAVPEGYPDDPVKGEPIDVSSVKDMEKLFFASVDISSGNLIETGSRAVACVGVADDIKSAERIVEREIASVHGPLFHRSDIGTPLLIQKRIDHMKTLRSE